MYISQIKVKNFRLLKDATLDLRKKISLLVGKNNTGKTSLLVLFEKFYKNQRFHYNDFSLSLREKILKIDDDTDIDQLSIKMII